MFIHHNKIVYKKIDTISDKFVDDFNQSREMHWSEFHSVWPTNKSSIKAWLNKIAKSQNDLVLYSTHLDDQETILGYLIIRNIDWINRNCLIGGNMLLTVRQPINNDNILSRTNRLIFRDCLRAGIDFAFEILNMHRVYAEVLETNLMSLYTSCRILNFKVEGTKRQHVFRHGQYIDSIIVGLLRDDWRKNRKYDQCFTNYTKKDIDINKTKQMAKIITKDQLEQDQNVSPII